jgi:hypothetical protein
MLRSLFHRALTWALASLATPTLGRCTAHKQSAGMINDALVAGFHTTKACRIFTVATP